MRVTTDWIDVCIHNMSSRGLMAGTDTPPKVGSYVEIRRGTQVIVGRVMWSRGRFFGIRSQDRLSVKAFVAEPRLAGRPPPADAADPHSADRRAERRLADEARLARRVERSRTFASMFQYGVMAAVVLAAAGIGASTVYDVLSKPADTITRSMADATGR